MNTCLARASSSTSSFNMDDDDDIQHLQFDCEVFDLSFHPCRDIIATGLIAGTVHLHSYSASDNDSNKALGELRHHNAACRNVCFSDDGSYLFTSSTDKSLAVVDLSTGALLYQHKNAHDHGVNALKVLSEGILATGDDMGEVKIWDLRQRAAVKSFKENEDYITEFQYDADSKTLVVGAGDGFLSVFSLHGKGKLLDQSCNQDDELLSMARMKNGRKLVVGYQEGVLGMFDWGAWGDVNDRFVGHPQSVDTLLPLNEDLLLTGSSDGLIRLVSIHPNKLLGVVGEHGDYPVERIRRSRDGGILGSCSHDQTVKFWNIGYLLEEGAVDTEGIQTTTQGETHHSSDSDSDVMDVDEDCGRQHGLKKQENFFDGLS